MKDFLQLPILISGECYTDLGQIETVLDAAGQPFMFVKRWQGDGLNFDRKQHAALIILGDENYWATSKKYAYDRALLTAALKAERSVLGICFGSQLLVAHMAGIANGRSLAKNPSQEHDGKLAPITFRGEGLTDPVMDALRAAPLATMSHKDSFQVPVVKACVGLAWSTDTTAEHCEAFRVGPPEAAVYGLQFHPEPTLSMLQNTRKGLRWFDPIPPDEKLTGVVETGRRTLEAWLSLARLRLQGESRASAHL